MHRAVALLLLLELNVPSAAAQSQIAGSKNYGLGGSSVMWLPRSSALFLNPAEFARLHQDEFLVSTHRLSSLPSLSVAHFEPFIGTFALGIANELSQNWYSAGYGRLVGGHQTVGGSVSVIREQVTRVAVSVGTSFHFPDSLSQYTGLHAGFSAVNLSSKLRSPLFGVNIGAAYWVLPNNLRWQAAWQLQGVNGSFLTGGEYLINSWASLQVGTLSFKKLTGGVSIKTSYVTADLALGDIGVSLSLNFRISEGAHEVRNSNFREGLAAYDGERYYEARKYFLESLQYDEYYSQAQTMANLATAAMETTLVVYIREGKSYEERGDFISAIKMYTQVLRANPDDEEAKTRLDRVKPKLRDLIQQLTAAGDSLRGVKKFDAARKKYRQLLEIDPENKEMPLRISAMDSLIRVNTQTRLARAKAALQKRQMEEARRQFEEVLLYDPRNTEARAGLESLKERRTAKELFERGKAAFDAENYLEALNIFLDVVQSDEKNRDAKLYLDRTRERLVSDVEDYFKQGLQLYVKEDYKGAVEVWNKALLINPSHQATLEYSRRAERKLEALEKLE